MASQTLLTKVHNWLTVGVAASVKLEAIGSSIAKCFYFLNGTVLMRCAGCAGQVQLTREFFGLIIVVVLVGEALFGRTRRICSIFVMKVVHSRPYSQR